MTMSDSRPGYGDPSTAQPNRLSWPRVLTRMLLIVVLGQLLGNLIGGTALTESEVLRERPGLGVLMILVLGGLVPGVGVGLLLRPDRDRLRRYALVGAAVAVATFLLLLGLAQLRLPATTPGASAGDFLQGSLIVAVVQSAVAIPLWLLRGRRTA